MTSLYMQLYETIRDEILKGVYPYGSKLASKRQICDDFGMSVITVEHAMSLLEEEGYIEPRERSGYYVSYIEGDTPEAIPSARKASGKSSSHPTTGHDFASSVSGHGTAHPASYNNGAFSSTDHHSQSSYVPTDSDLFPFGVYARTIRRVLTDRAETIFTKSPNKGTPELREAISSYLARNRNIYVSPEQIIIGSGAEYLYGMVVQILGRDRTYGIEKPSYEKIEQVYGANDVKCRLLALGHDGILTKELEKTDADVLHITPYRSYPSGVTANAAKRREYIRWTESKKNRFIVEDDFESEFTPSTKAQETVFSLSEKGSVIYINTFSRTIAPSMRIGYMVLPEKLLSRYEKRAGFYSCAVPTFEQYILAEFIDSGDFERHINRVRRKKRHP